MTPEDFRKLPIIERLDALAARTAAQESSHSIKKALGLNRYELSHLRRLDRCLSDTAKHLINKNRLSEGHARALARLSHPQQERLVRDTLQKQWSVRDLEQAVKATIEGGDIKDKSADARYYDQLGTNISEQIGHPVKIQPSQTPDNGQIIITYFGLDSFDGILKRLRIKLPDDM